MYLIELVGGPMDGHQRAVENLSRHIVVHGTPSPPLIEKYKDTDKALQVFEDYYLMVNPESDEGTKMSDTGELIHIYKFLKGDGNVRTEL